MGWPVLGYLRGKNFRRRDRDHLVPPRRTDAAVWRAEVCYPFGREHGWHRAVRRREFITLLGGAVGVAARGARAAAGDAGNRVPRQRVGCSIRRPRSRFPSGPERNRLCRGPECGDRVPLGGRSPTLLARADEVIE
jgi:hypothetical protein